MVHNGPPLQRFPLRPQGNRGTLTIPLLTLFVFQGTGVCIFRGQAFLAHDQLPPVGNRHPCCSEMPLKTSIGRDPGEMVRPLKVRPCSEA